MTDVRESATEAACPRCQAYLASAGIAEERWPALRMRDLGDGTWLMVTPLLFHWSLTRGDFDDPVGYFDRWCYSDRSSVLAAFDAFPVNPPDDHEPQGWHRHPPTGRRRPEGDASREYRER